jgi:UDP-glucuronate 4-epimerase
VKVVITGIAGFIGFHLSDLLLRNKYTLLGIDNLNTYYDIELKKTRLVKLGINEISTEQTTKSVKFDNLIFKCLDICEFISLDQIICDFKPDIIIHLAAQAGVRYSLINPGEYIQSNINGFFNILEICRKHDISRLVYASSSSVYGNQKDVPYREIDQTDKPISIYAATKKSNELLAYTYSHLYGIKSVGLRFFTVYGPYGRPDMAYFSFVKNILKGHPINVFNNGNLTRDFTYVDDIVLSILNIVNNFDKISKNQDYNIFNIGNSDPVRLIDFINIIEKILGKSADLNFLSMQNGDVFNTFADVSKLEKEINFRPSTPLSYGLEMFVKWYKEFYGQ